MVFTEEKKHVQRAKKRKEKKKTVIRTHWQEAHYTRNTEVGLCHPGRESHDEL
jgi:hypothetical protein